MIQEICKNENEKLFITEILIGDYIKDNGEVMVKNIPIDNNYLIKTKIFIGLQEIAKSDFKVILIKTKDDYLAIDELGG